MGRYYHLSKKVTEEEMAEITREMRQVTDVEQIEFTDDHAFMKVVTQDDEFMDVMVKAVNICSRVGHGLELSFARFAFL